MDVRTICLLADGSYLFSAVNDLATGRLSKRLEKEEPKDANDKCGGRCHGSVGSGGDGDCMLGMYGIGSRCWGEPLRRRGAEERREWE